MKGWMVSIVLLVCSGVGYGEYVTLEDFVIGYVDHIQEDIPDSYQYIDLYFTDIASDDVLYGALQQAVYMDIIANLSIDLPRESLITERSLAMVAQAHRGRDMDASDDPVSEEYFADFLASLPLYRSYYCAQEAVVETIDLSAFAITEAEGFGMLDDVYDRLTSEYLYRDSLDDILLMRGAIDGMVNVVGDEYTSFFTPGDSEEFQTALGESYSGIGVVVEPSDNGLIVISPFRGSPAMDGGLQPGDVITHVDGVSIMDIGAEAVDLIKGPSNTEVTLTITRDDDSYDKVFMRSAVSFEMVDREQQDDNFVISILSFGYGVSVDVRLALEAYQSSDADTLIRDLRNNPGGSVEELENILSMLLPAGTDTFAFEGQGFAYSGRTAGDDLMVDDDMIILINGGSASAAEMMALVLSEYDRATLVGEQTFGKGTAQSLIDYNDGSSFKYTIYERSVGDTSVQGIGISPDYLVTNDGDKDDQLDFAKRL